MVYGWFAPPCGGAPWENEFKADTERSSASSRHFIGASQGQRVARIVEGSNEGSNAACGQRSHPDKVRSSWLNSPPRGVASIKPGSEAQAERDRNHSGRNISRGGIVVARFGEEFGAGFS